MPYLGRPVTNAGQFEIIDDISSSFNGSNTSFTLQVGGTNIQPDSANVTIALDGVIQIPSTAYSITGSTLNFSEAPENGTGFHGVLAGQSQFIESDFITDTHIKSTANISGSKINTDFSAQNIQITHITSSGNISGSSSSTISAGTFTGTFSGAVSSSVLSSPSQGTVRLATNGVNTDVDTGLQSGDSPTFTGGTITGDLSVGGTLTAQEIHTEFTSASILFTSGSTIFGNSSDDVHNMTGSLNISGSLFVKDGTLTVTDNVDFNGDLDVDGTTNLDVVDIDGAVDMASNLTVAGNVTGSSTSTGSFGAVSIGGSASEGGSKLGVNGNIEILGGGNKLFVPRASDGALTTSIFSRTGNNLTLSGAGSSGGQIEFIPSSANSSAVAMTIDSSQRVAVGNTSPAAVGGYYAPKFSVEGDDYKGVISVIEHQNGISGGIVSIGKSRGTSAGAVTILQTDDITGRLLFSSADGVDFRVISAEIRTLVGASPAANDVPGHLLFMTNDGSGVDSTERMRIASDGKVFIGSTASRTLSGVTPQVQVEGLDYGTSSMSLIGNTGTDAGTAPLLMFGRSRGTSDGTSTAVASGDRLGAIFFTGADGTDINTVSSYIEARIDGSVSGNTMPGRIQFYTNSGGSSASERMRIDKDGNVGIGTTSINSNAKVHIRGGDSGQTASSNNTQLTVESNGTAGIQLLTGTTSVGGFWIGDSNGSETGGKLYYSNNNDRWSFYNAGSTLALSISTTGIGIGEESPYSKVTAVETESKAAATFYNTRNPSSSPPHCLDLNFAYTPDNTTSYFIKGSDNLGSSATAEFHVYSDGSFVQSSDRRKKENIVDSENQLDKINQLKVRDYNKINDSSKKKHIGFIAQELQEVFPHLVIEAEDDAKTLQIYKIGIVPLLVKAVQELSAKVEALEST